MAVPESIIAEGASRFGVDARSLRPLESSAGASFSCRQGSRACVIKFLPMPPERLAAFEEKQAFVLYLAEKGAPASVPQESAGGRRYETLAGPEGMYVATLAVLAGGRHPTPRNLYDWNERLFACWGQVVGQMHRLARAYPRWRKPAPGEEGPPSALYDWSDEHASFAALCAEPKIAARWRELREPLDALPRERAGYGLVHNDLHMGNFLYHPDARGQQRPITIIDFDVCAYHWFITDIAIAVYHAAVFGPRRSLPEREAFARHFLQHFMGGYRQENDLDPAWLEQLPLFLRYRETLSYIALSNEWPVEQRSRWQIALLAEKRARILRGEALVRGL